MGTSSLVKTVRKLLKNVLCVAQLSQQDRRSICPDQEHHSMLVLISASIVIDRILVVDRRSGINIQNWISRGCLFGNNRFFCFKGKCWTTGQIRWLLNWVLFILVLAWGWGNPCWREQAIRHQKPVLVWMLGDWLGTSLRAATCTNHLLSPAATCLSAGLRYSYSEAKCPKRWWHFV